MYTLSNFETVLFNSHTRVEGQNTIGRLRNSLVNLVNQQTFIPKWVVVVVEDDIIKSFDATRTANQESAYYGSVLEHIMKEHNTIMDEFKDMIPDKAKKHGWPFFLWVVPTLHEIYDNNSARDKFIRCLKMVENLHDNVISLELEQVWSSTDRSLFQPGTTKLSIAGYNALWKGIDKTIRYADINVLRHGNKRMKEIFLDKKLEKSRREQYKFDRFNRHQNNYRHHEPANEQFTRDPVRRRIDFNDPDQYRLPPPPPHRRGFHY